MKKRNLIVSLATLGAVAAVATSAALYIVKPEDESIHIGVNTNVDVNYLISDVTDDATLINPTTPTRNYDFSIAGKVNETSAFKQPYVLAKLTVTITPSVASLGSYITPTCKLNYTEGTHFANTESLNTITFGEAAAETGVITGSLTTYIRVADDASLGGTAVDLGITLNSVDGETFVTTLANATYDVKIDLTTDEDYQVAYLVGTMNGWTESDAYEMVANIEAAYKEDGSGFEWMWLGNVTEGSELKAKHENKTWSVDPNNVAPANMTGAYWNGKSDSPVTFSTSDQGTGA